MNIKVLPMLALFFVLGLLVCPAGFTAMYKYIDTDGLICIADDLQSIPEQYREKAEIVRGKVEEEKKPLTENQPQARQEIKPEITAPSLAQEQAPVDGIKKRFIINKVMISIMIVVSALFAFVILGILDADHKKSVKIARVVILWGMSVYLIYAHAGDVVRLFGSTRNTIDAAHQKAGEKGEKAAKALKEMNALMQNVDNPDSQDAGGANPEKRD
jgi:hypothetical protein